ncbi:HTH_38 domain-containing protein [Trichonephila clavipes]|nr:HTH_38 domain-containing protein [Trichonephila clavipes]
MRHPEGIKSRRKQQSAFDQVSEFDRGRIVAYRDCGLSLRKIGSRVGRNQTTCLRVPFDAVYSRVVCPQDVHCLVYPGRRTTDVSAANGVMKEGCGWQNGRKLSLLTSHACVCNTPMVGFESEDTGERGC